MLKILLVPRFKVGVPDWSAIRGVPHVPGASPNVGLFPTMPLTHKKKTPRFGRLSSPLTHYSLLLVTATTFFFKNFCVFSSGLAKDELYPVHGDSISNSRSKCARIASIFESRSSM